MRSQQPNNLNTFLIIWSGQLVSTLCSEMTGFAMTIWAWELTGKATPLALIGYALPILRNVETIVPDYDQSDRA